MSATMFLYKPQNVRVIGHTYYDLSKEARQYIYNNPEDDDNPYEYIWSDGREHNHINLSDYDSIAYRGYQTLGKWERNWHRYHKRLVSNFNFQRYVSCGSDYQAFIIPVEEVLYWQGWGLSNRFFKKRHTVYFAITKKQMSEFLKKHTRPRNHYDIETFRSFFDKWEDGMIFECSL